jgi:hypothetical protein
MQSSNDAWTPGRDVAGVAQLVEHDVANVVVVSSVSTSVLPGTAKEPAQGHSNMPNATFPNTTGDSSVGRALHSQCQGREFICGRDAKQPGRSRPPVRCRQRDESIVICPWRWESASMAL